jgi:TfoX/Sxy family transcriptional regulator of competence genes
MHSKSPPELVDRFATLTDPLLADPDVERRKMFGYPACFVGGHMFTGLHGDRWIVRLDESSIVELTAAGGTGFEPMAGRPMRGFVVLPPLDDAALGAWLDRALQHARSLPPKPAKPSRR